MQARNPANGFRRVCDLSGKLAEDQKRGAGIVRPFADVTARQLALEIAGMVSILFLV
ncbi:hypothetical protein [Herbaspirillum sp.]|uniref:hypothetical protein n=1 Tax=Herbaspirillum sp. TaxID=1890675 RepID=UPI0031DB2F0D